MTQENLVPVVLDPNYVSRQESARRACEAVGIVWPETILPPGTALYKEGLEKLKADRRAWKRLPLASEVVGLVTSALASEDRKDFPEEVANLRLRPADGRIVRKQNLLAPVGKAPGLGYGPHTLRQLVAQVDPLDDAPRGFSSALLYLNDQERAEILNKRLDAMDKAKPDGDRTAVTLRTRLPHYGDGSRIVRAALSSIYVSLTDHDIAGVIGEMLVGAGDTTSRLDYKPGDSHSRFEVIWPSEIPVETFVVGDVHYGMLSIGNSDTGEGSVWIAPAVVRARCANLTISIGQGIEESFQHRGDPAALLLRLKKAIRRAMDDMEPLLRTISQSATIQLGEVWNPAKALEAIARRYEQPKIAAAAWVEQFKKSGYPNSVWGVAGAISEASHDADNWIAAAEWEKLASDVQAKAVEVVRKGTPHALALEKALAVN